MEGIKPVSITAERPRGYDPEHYLGHLRERKGKTFKSHHDPKDPQAVGTTEHPEVLHVGDALLRKLLSQEPGVILCNNKGEPSADGEFLRLS